MKNYINLDKIQKKAKKIGRAAKSLQKEYKKHLVGINRATMTICDIESGRANYVQVRELLYHKKRCKIKVQYMKEQFWAIPFKIVDDTVLCIVDEELCTDHIKYNDIIKVRGIDIIKIDETY